jgi:hypothetical protein
MNSDAIEDETFIKKQLVKRDFVFKAIEMTLFNTDETF